MVYVRGDIIVLENSNIGKIVHNTREGKVHVWRLLGQRIRGKSRKEGFLFRDNITITVIFCCFYNLLVELVLISS